MSRALSLLFPYVTSSAHSTRTPAPLSLLFTSPGDDHCHDPRPGTTFGRPAESDTLAGYEPNDLIEMNNTGVTPTFFHRPSVTSTCNSAESIATPPPESDLDDEHKRDNTCAYWRKKQVQTNHEFITPTKKTLCQSHHVFEQARRDLQLCSHTQESRVKNLTPTETVFPWNIEQFKQKMKSYSDSPNRKMTQD